MAAGVVSFTLAQNGDFIQPLVWKDANGNPIDLTGYTAKMSIGDRRPPVVTYYTILSTGMNPGITLGGDTGIITLTIPVDIVQDFSFVNAVYDLLLTSPSDITTPLLQGNIIIAPGVTSPPA